MKTAIIALFVFSFFLANAQTRVFFSKSHMETVSDSSYYFSVGYLNDSGLYNDTVKYFFSESGKLKGTEFYLKGNLHGEFTFFHENGKIFKRGHYYNGAPKGRLDIFYQNGKPHQVIELGEFDKTGFQPIKILDFFDSLGNKIVSKGDGYCRGVVDRLPTMDPQYSNQTIPMPQVMIDFSNRSERGDLSSFFMIGKVRSGVKDSVWNGYADKILCFTERYDKGKFVRGKRFVDKGEFTYNEIEESANPTNGMTSFYQFVAKHMRYPAEAIQKGIQGRVFVMLVINKDGSVSDVKVLRGVGGGCDEEAVRVVSKSPPWQPGKQRGISVRQRMVMPIIFKLG